jgi:DNA replication protein DnaC
MNNANSFEIEDEEPVSLAKLKLMMVDPTPRKATCETHGEFDSRNVFGSVWTKCPACSAIENENAKRAEMEREAAEKQRQWERRLGESGIPVRFMDRTLEKFEAKNEGQKSAHAFATEYAEKFSEILKTGRSAIFCGKPGTGKTHLSVGIGLSVMKRGGIVLFTTVQRMMRRIKDAWRKDSDESESDVVSLFSSPDLMIIDEIGVQFGSDFERNAMFDVLNERYENRLPTLLLSNLSPSEVKVFLGERVFDRLREDGGACVPFNWDSHRGVAS